MSSDLNTLLEMGFDKSRAEMAVKRTGGLEGAINWLEKNQDTPLDELEAEEAGPSVDAEALGEGQVAQSIVCNDCGKKFRTKQLAGFHAEKTSSPLTEEEKAQRLQDMRAALAEKRAKQAIVDKEEQKRNEAIRMKATKETQDMKEEIARKEQIKEAAKKRQEKLDDAEAKKRIKAKIEADKEERRRKAEEAKAAREGRAPAAAAAPTPVAAPAPSRPAATHNEARLRLQLPSGNVMKTLPAETTLFEVAQILQTESGATVTKFVMNFPRKTFEGIDFGKTLKEAGLVPSAALIVQ
ncbi:UBX domain-containing protein [Apiospora rasikravindrae]|uniref:UBX domain-containing protein n=1 Tax=Apiospora rasikravindrae TaxID=990691 RepID=A0ABR1S2H2_9PEZI